MRQCGDDVSWYVFGTEIGRRKVLSERGTLKMRMGATHFAMKRLPKVATEMALHVLAYNLTRVMNIMGPQPADGRNQGIVRAEHPSHVSNLPRFRPAQRSVLTRPRPICDIDWTSYSGFNPQPEGPSHAKKACLLRFISRTLDRLRRIPFVMQCFRFWR